MPDGALVSTERQVFDLLRGAADGDQIHLRLYALPTVVRSEWGREHLRRYYYGLDNLCRARLDGLVVTGAEPRARELSEEPYWSDLRRVIEWAKTGTTSTIWSCLAVHAAVHHIDGIARRSLREKCIGVFQQWRIKDHPMLKDTGQVVPVPHSRWNEIPEEPLRANGYEILTHGAESGIGLFAKRQSRCLFVFLQGHPEYETLSLLGEYRRDVGRFLRGECDQYPTMPSHYFSEAARQSLLEFREQALWDRRAEFLARFPVTAASRGVQNTWRDDARQLYRNWLSILRTSDGCGAI